MTEREAVHFSGLLLKYLRKQLSAEEEQLFLRSVAADPGKQELLNYYKDSNALKETLDYMNRLDTGDAWTRVSGRLDPNHLRTGGSFGWKWLKYAAMLAIVLSAGILWYTRNTDRGIIRENPYGFKNDVLPGTDQAVLLLSDGSRVALDSSRRSISDRGANSSSASGEVRYRYPGKAGTSLVNEIHVPASGQYKVVLSDGTKVWMNASSTLKFPVLFNNRERRVTLEGEAYFEVSKDADRPFYVQVKDRTIKVLGTRFNVSAYTEQVTTTLVEGSVKITDSKTAEMLAPGQQAVSGSGGISIYPANVKKAVAWKDEYFVFDQDDIRSIMDQLARWYKVDIQYKGKADREAYSGSMPRSSTLGGVLQMLSDVSNLQFTIDGRQVTVISAADQ